MVVPKDVGTTNVANLIYAVHIRSIVKGSAATICIANVCVISSELKCDLSGIDYDHNQSCKIK